jgi:hypothetical protein
VGGSHPLGKGWGFDIEDPSNSLIHNKKNSQKIFCLKFVCIFVSRQDSDNLSIAFFVFHRVNFLQKDLGFYPDLFVYCGQKRVMKKLTSTRSFKFFLVLFTLAFNILFNFVPLGGYGTGLQAIYNESPFMGIVLVCILLYALGGSLYFFIKNV